MPYSSNTFDDVLYDHIVRLSPTSILDVGAGAGKNGKLARVAGYNKQLDAIEPTEGYITDFKIDTVYNKIYNQSLEQYIKEHPTNRYDLVIFGDVLEHLFRSQAMDYLDYFLYRSKWVIMIWPTHAPQDDWGNNHYEVHKSNFVLNDITQKFKVEYFVKNYNCDNPEPASTGSEFNYCVIKGHMTSQRDNIYNFVSWK